MRLRTMLYDQTVFVWKAHRIVLQQQIEDGSDLVDYWVVHFTGGPLQQPAISSSSLSNRLRSICIERGCTSHLWSRTVRPCDWPNTRQIALTTHVPTDAFQVWSVGIQRSSWFRPILHRRLLRQEGHDPEEILSMNISIHAWQPDRAGHKKSVWRAFVHGCWSNGPELATKYCQGCRVCWNFQKQAQDASF